MDDPTRRALDPERARTAGHALVDRVADYLRKTLAGEGPVMAWQAPEDLAAAWPVEVGAAPTQALGPLFDRVAADAIHQHHPRCFGHQVAVPWPSAALTEIVLGVLNNGMASYESGPVSSALEKNVVGWLAERMGYGAGADGVLTSGGTLGTLTGLLAARQRLDDFDPKRGSQGRPLAVLTSAHAHYAVARAAVVMGWGTEGVIPVDVDDRFRLDVDRIDDAMAVAEARGRRVIGIVATAGTSVTGAYDPIAPLADRCEAEGLWLHVDGAHGASAVMSARYRHLLEGAPRADSLVWDAHKLLGVPAPASVVLFRDGTASYAPFAQDASYLFAPGEEPERWYDYGLRNMECTKRMMSVSIYAALTTLGTDLLDRTITSRFDLARRFAAILRESDDFEVAVEPQGNIVCFRHLRDGEPLGDEAHDRVRETVVRSGRFFFTRSSIGGRAWMRTTLMNPLTTEDDLLALLEAIRATPVG